MTEFLLSRVNESTGAQPPRDVIIYYVGHGSFSGTDYFLALRKTRPNKPYSGYPIKALAQTLRENARYSRKCLLLDCCFAAKAVAEFQGGGALQAGVQKTVEEFEGQDPGRGTALLCAPGPETSDRLLLGLGLATVEEQQDGQFAGVHASSVGVLGVQILELEEGATPAANTTGYCFNPVSRGGRAGPLGTASESVAGVASVLVGVGFHAQTRRLWK